MARLVALQGGIMEEPVADLKKGAWSPEEDRKLVSYIMNYGIWNWSQMPKYAGLSRTGKSCRLRWMNYLRPDVRRGPFSTQEVEILVQTYLSLGNKWSAIAARLPGRTDNEVKNFYHTHLKKLLPPANGNTPSRRVQTAGGRGLRRTTTRTSSNNSKINNQNIINSNNNNNLSAIVMQQVIRPLNSCDVNSQENEVMNVGNENSVSSSPVILESDSKPEFETHHSPSFTSDIMDLNNYGEDENVAFWRSILMEAECMS